MSRGRRTHRSIRRHLAGAGMLCAVLGPVTVMAQEPPGPMERCNVQIGNRVAPVDPRGQWRVNDVAATGNRQRARLVCESPVSTRTGFSDLGAINPSRVTMYRDITFNGSSPGPTRITLEGPTMPLADTTPVLLRVVATFAGGATQDVTSADAGTDWVLTDPTVASVGADGTFTPVRSGNVLVTAVNEGVSASLLIRVAIGPDADGDGIPDDWERNHRLDPNDPTDALTDTDADNLVNRDEYNAGTDPFSKDTDGDGIEDQEETLPGADGVVTSPLLPDTDGDIIPDALELDVGTNPADGSSVDLDASIVELRVRPALVRLVHSPLRDQPSQQLRVVAELLDGTGVDLTGHALASYTVANRAIADMGPTRGLVIGIGPAGDTTLSVELTGTIHATVVPVEARLFEPQALGAAGMPPGCPSASRIIVADPYVYVNCGALGVQVVGLPPAANVRRLGEIVVPGAGPAMAGQGEYIYVATATGVVPINVFQPLTPHVFPEVAVGAATPWMAADEGLLAVAVPGEVRLFALDDPAHPEPMGVWPVTGNIRRVELRGSLLAVGVQGAGVRLVDVSAPVNPVLLSTLGGAHADTFGLGDNVLVSGASFTARPFNITNPASPVQGADFTSNVFVMTDIAVRGSLALVADIFRVNSVPILQARNPQQLVYAGLVEFSSLGDDNAYSIGADRQFVAIMTSANRVLVGRYDVESDSGAVPPTCRWLTPSPASLFVEGARILAAADATDDVRVSRVIFTLDGTTVLTDVGAPYSGEIRLPLDTNIHTLGATSYDLAGNATACPNIAVYLQADPGTSLVGRVLDRLGAPVTNAQVTVLDVGAPVINGAADGTFSAAALPSANPLMLEVRGTAAGFACQQAFGPFYPVSGGNTDVGDLVLSKYIERNVGGPLVSPSVGFATSYQAPTPLALSRVGGALVSASVGFDTTYQLPTVLGLTTVGGALVSPSVGFSTDFQLPTVLDTMAVAGALVSPSVGFHTSYQEPQPLASALVGGALVSPAVGFDTTYGVTPPLDAVVVGGALVSPTVSFVGRPLVTSVVPAQILRGTGVVSVTLQGHGFLGATGLRFYTRTGLALETRLTATPPTVAGDGLSLTTGVSADTATPTGLYVVEVLTPSGNSFVEDTGGNLLEVLP